MALGDSSIGLLFKLRADSKDATAEISNFRAHVANEAREILRSLPGGSALEKFALGTKAHLKDVDAALGNTGKAGASSLSSIASSAGVAVLGIGAVVVAAAGLVAGLFSLANSAAAADEKIYDLSQKTGFSAETLSALGVAAEQSGSSLEEVGTGLVKFTNNLAAAAQGNKALSATFAKLGIDAKQGLNDPEAAFAKFIENFAKLQTAQERVIYASDLFGKRMGANLVQTFESVNGNIDEFKKKVAEAGGLISGKAAADADKFKDQLTALHQTFGNITRQVGEAFMPIILSALEKITGWFQANRESIVSAITTIGNTAVNVVELIGAVLVPLLKILEYTVLPILQAINAVLSTTVDLLAGVFTSDQTDQDNALADQDKREKDWLATHGGNNSDKRGAANVNLPGKGGGEDKARAEAIRKLEQESKEIQRVYANETQKLKDEYDAQGINLKRFTDATLAQITDYYNKRKDVINREKALAKTPAESEKYENELKALKDETDRATREAQKNKDDTEKAARQKHLDAMLDLQEQFGKQQAEILRRQADARAISFEDSERRISELEAQTNQARLGNLIAQREDLYKALKDKTGDLDAEVNQEELGRINDQIKAIETIETAAQSAREQRIRDAHNRDIDEQRKYQEIMLDAEAQFQDVKNRIEVENIRLLNEDMRTRALAIARRATLDLNAADAESRANKARIAGQRAAALEELSILERQLTAKKALDAQRKAEELARFKDDADETTVIWGKYREIEQENADRQKEIEARRQEVQTEFHDLDIQELERWTQERARIMKEANDAAAALDPNSGLSLFGQDYQDSIDRGEGKFKAFGQTVMGVLGGLSSQAGNFRDMFKSVFAALGDAIGQTIKNFILLGSAGKSFRQFAAEVIASVAEMAAVKAVFEFAEGLAALVWNPADAAKHFAASAKYATVAAIATVAGRLVAGSSFQNQTAGAGGGAGGAGGGSGTGGGGVNPNRGGGATDQGRTIEMGRNQIVEHIITIRLEPGVVADHAVKDIQGNGRLRTVLEKLAGVPVGTPS